MKNLRREYLLTSAIYNHIVSMRNEEPACERCGKPLKALIGENVSARVSNGRRKYYCDKCNPDDRRI